MCIGCNEKRKQEQNVLSMCPPRTRLSIAFPSFLFLLSLSQWRKEGGREGVVGVAREGE